MTANVAQSRLPSSSNPGSSVDREAYAEGKVQPYEMGMEDFYAVGAEASSHRTTPLSGVGGDTSYLAASPLLHNGPTDTGTDMEDGMGPVTPPLRPSHNTPPVQLSSSAPPPQKLHGLLHPQPMAHPERHARTAARTAQPSPSPQQRQPAPFLSPLQMPQTPPQTARPRDGVRPMAELEATPPPAPLPPLLSDVATSSPARDCASLPAPSPRVRAAFEEEPDVCCICLEEYTTENPMLRGECNHHFHLACLMEWKQRSNSCPMCCAETLHGVGDPTTPHVPKAVNAAEAARQREIAARDEALARKLQRKYLRRAQQEQQQQQQARALLVPTRLAPAPAPAPAPTSVRPSTRPTATAVAAAPAASGPRSLPPLASDRGVATHHSRHTVTVRSEARPVQARRSPTTTAPPSTAVAAAAPQPKRHKTRKGHRVTATPPAAAGSARQSPSSAAPPPHHGHQRQRRRSSPGACSVM